jgi:hypothetical protein
MDSDVRHHVPEPEIAAAFLELHTREGEGLQWRQAQLRDACNRRNCKVTGFGLVSWDVGTLIASSTSREPG